MSPPAIRDAVEELLPSAEQLLCNLISYPSTPGRELEAMSFLQEAFRATGANIERVPLSDAIISDPDYSTPIPDIRYDGRFNLRIQRSGQGDGRSLLLNTHVDVVPPSENMPDPWTPRVKEGIVFGRGACDAKGQIALIFLVFKAIQALRLKLRGDVTAHIVVEEENGGNGTLSMIRRGVKADACIVLEPSESRLHTSIRGAVWFRLLFTGRAGHSGQAAATRSALLMALDAMVGMERYHADLLARSREVPLFESYPNPMPLTFGHLEAGNWPASAPSRAVLEGVLGFLPNRTKEEVCRDLRQVLAGRGEEFVRNCDLSFMYRHDSSVLSPGHDLPRGLLRAAGETGQPLSISGMPASCDAWFYNNQSGIPTVVFGPGSLRHAHSKDEQIAMRDIGAAAGIVLSFLEKYCGASE